MVTGTALHELKSCRSGARGEREGKVLVDGKARMRWRALGGKSCDARNSFVTLHVPYPIREENNNDEGHRGGKSHNKELK